MMQTHSRPRSSPATAQAKAKAASQESGNSLSAALNRAPAVQTQLKLDRSLNQRKENQTGMPDHVKNGVESLSGVSLDDVSVHYNSPLPAQLQAHASTQETDIHLAPGQSRHLAHEAWHVVQQKQGRVAPTMQVGGMAVNDDPGLEREADVMGQRAAAFKGI